MLIKLFRLWLLTVLSGYATYSLAAEPVKQIDSIAVRAIDQFAAVQMPVHIFKPEGAGPFTVVLFSHGRAPSPADRASFSTPVASGHVDFWLRKGFAVVAPIRPGYGPNGGPDRESSGSKVNTTTHQCQSEGDLTPFLRHGLQALRAAHDWIRSQPWAKRDSIILEGQSVGGLLTVVYGSENPSGVIGFINFSGGAAGYPAEHIGHSCADNQIAQAFGMAGQKNRTPNLWLYAENDGFWGADAPRRWHYLFAKANPNQTTFVRTAALKGNDGHFLLNYGGNYWRDPVNSFVKSLNVR
jgi:dienelactone hydrolase